MSSDHDCKCPACKHERSGSPVPYIPVGQELLEELDAHPERARVRASAIAAEQLKDAPLSRQTFANYSALRDGIAAKGDGHLVAARFTVYLSAAVPAHGEGMGDAWDRIHEALDAIPGVFSEGGGSELMEADDLIEDSPLDLYLKGANGA